MWTADQLHPGVRVCLHLGYRGRHCTVTVRFHIVSFYFILRNSRLLETRSTWPKIYGWRCVLERQRKHTFPNKKKTIITAIELYNLLWPNDTTLLKLVRGYLYPEASIVCNSQLTLLSEVTVIHITFTKSDRFIRT